MLSILICIYISNKVSVLNVISITFTIQISLIHVLFNILRLTKAMNHILNTLIT